MRKSIVPVLVAAILLSVLCPGVALGQGDTPTDPSFILMDTVTGQILTGERADVRRAPASVTKVMTMLLAVEAVKEGKASYDDVVRVSAKAAGIGGSQIYLAEGERITLHDLMIAIAVASANDACVAVAEHMAGTEEVFVALMNREAERLGLTNTHFTNTNGLPEDSHYSSAHDLAVITRELVLRHPEVLEWTSARYTTIRDGKTTLYNTNKLLGQVDGLNGMKTGHTQNAGHCLSATASRGEEHRISVVMGYPTESERWQKTSELLEYGFRAFDRLNPAKQVILSARSMSETASALRRVPRRTSFLVELTQRQSQHQIIQDESKPIAAGTRVGVRGDRRARVNGVLVPSEMSRANAAVRAFDSQLLQRSLWRW